MSMLNVCGSVLITVCRAPVLSYGGDVIKFAGKLDQFNILLVLLVRSAFAPLLQTLLKDVE